MGENSRPSIRSLFEGWIIGWAVWVFSASMAIAAAGLSPLAAGRNLALATFEVADEVAPLAKIGFGFLFGLVIWLERRSNDRGLARNLIAVMVGAGLATLAVQAFLPADWSRGFGIGLSGRRFDPVLTGIYLCGSVAAALAFVWAHNRRERKSRAIHQRTG